MAKAPSIPHPYIKSLPPADQARLKRNFDELTRNWAAMPYTVVAADGTGDFKSITAAIASLPNGANNFSHLIYVKSSSTAYDDTALTQVDIGKRNVTIMGQDADSVGFQTDGQISSPLWTFTYFDNLSGSTGNLRIINMQLVPTQTNSIVFKAAGTAAPIDFQFDHCTIASLFGTVVSGAGTLNDCTVVGPLFFDTITIAELTVSRCKLSGGIATTGKTLTITGGGSNLRIIECRIVHSSQVFTISYGNLGGGQNNLVEFIANRWSRSSTCTITFNKFENSDTLHIIDNTGTMSDITIAIAGSAAAVINLDSNNCPATALIITEAAGSQSESLYIGGIYKSIACAATGVQISAVLNQLGITGGTALTISGSQCSAMVGIIPGTTTTGVNLSGNNNYVIAPNVTSCATPSTISGSGNVLNGVTNGNSVQALSVGPGFLLSGM